MGKLFKKLYSRKGDIAVLAIAIYLAAKIYVQLTPSPDDDPLPDKVKNAVLTVIYSADDDTIPADDSENGIYGERD